MKQKTQEVLVAEISSPAPMLARRVAYLLIWWRYISPIYAEAYFYIEHFIATRHIPIVHSWNASNYHIREAPQFLSVRSRANAAISLIDEEEDEKYPLRIIQTIHTHTCKLAKFAKLEHLVLVLTYVVAHLILWLLLNNCCWETVHCYTTYLWLYIPYTTLR